MGSTRKFARVETFSKATDRKSFSDNVLQNVKYKKPRYKFKRDS